MPVSHSSGRAVLSVREAVALLCPYSASTASDEKSEEAEGEVPVLLTGSSSSLLLPVRKTGNSLDLPSTSSESELESMEVEDRGRASATLTQSTVH